MGPRSRRLFLQEIGGAGLGIGLAGCLRSGQPTTTANVFISSGMLTIEPGGTSLTGQVRADDHAARDLEPSDQFDPATGVFSVSGDNGDTDRITFAEGSLRALALKLESGDSFDVIDRGTILAENRTSFSGRFKPTPTPTPTPISTPTPTPTSTPTPTRNVSRGRSIGDNFEADHEMAPYSSAGASYKTETGTAKSNAPDGGSYHGYVSEYGSGPPLGGVAVSNETTAWDRSYRFEFLVRCSEYNPEASYNDAWIAWRGDLRNDGRDSLRLRTFSTGSGGKERSFRWTGKGVESWTGTHEIEWVQGIWYWIKGEVNEANGKGRAKIWKATADEPAEYQVSANIRTGVSRGLPYHINVDGKPGESRITFDIAHLWWKFESRGEERV